MVFETWLESDLKKPVQVKQLRGNLFSGDVGGNLIGVEIMDNGVVATGISGTVRGYAILANNQTIVIEGSQWCTLTGNKVTVTMPTGVYSIVGPISIVIKVGTVTVAACTSYVYRSRTDAVIDPGNVVPSLDALLQKLSDCEAATTAAENVNATASKSGNVITVTVTDRNGTPHVNTLQEPTVSVTPHDRDFDLSVTDANGSQTVTIPNPNKELSDRAHVETVSRSKTRTGNPIQIEDAVNEIADKTVIKLVPKQDLHGFSRPWVGGAGKNLGKPYTFSATQYSSSFSYDGTGKVHIKYSNSGTALSYPLRSQATDFMFAIPAGTYTISARKSNGETISGVTPSFVTPDNVQHQGTFTISESTTGFVRANVESSASNFEEDLYLQLEVGSSVTSWEPYANLCPISGYDTVRVLAARKNLFDPNVASLETLQLLADGSAPRKGHSFDSGVYTIHNRASGMNYYRIVKKDLSDLGTTVNIGSGISVNNVNVDSDHMLWVFNQMNSTYETFDGLCVERGASQAYEEWEGQTSVIAVSLATNGNQTAGTVYSGTVTLLADGSGTVVVDKKHVEFDGSSDEAWEWRTAELRAVIGAVSGIKGSANTRIEVMSNYGRFAASNNDPETLFAYSTGNLYYTPQRIITSAAELKTFLAANNLQIVYELATPVTYTLTANQVQTLLGYNYIYTDGAEIALTYRQESLATNETLLKLLPTGSASGNPVTFSDGADGVPLKQLVVNVQPNQDLHGYEKPWVAGAGKNLINSADVALTRFSQSGEIFTNTEADTRTGFNIYVNNVQRGTITSTGIKTVSVTVSETLTQISVKHNGSSKDLVIKFNNVSVPAGEYTLVLNVVSCNPTAIGGLVLKNIMLMKATETDTTWVPYENLCPIRGWDEVPLLRTGKNMLSGNYTWKQEIRNDNGSISLNSGSHHTNAIHHIKPGTSYTISGNLVGTGTSSTIGFRVYFLTAEEQWIQRSAVQTSAPYTFTTPNNCESIQIQVATALTLTDAQLEEASSASSFEPFKGKVYDISIPSEAGTVYGCQITLDENGEGTLTVNTEKLVAPAITEFTGTSSTGNYKYVRLISNRSEIDVTLNTNNVLSECLKSVSYESPRTPWSCYSVTSTQNGNSIMVFADENTTVAEFNNAVQGTILIAKLANPVTYRLTADQVKTLLGTNIISSDAGTVSIKYFKMLGEEQDLSVYAKKNNPVFTGTAYKFGSHTFSLDDFAVLKILINEYDGGIPVEPADPNSGGIEEEAPVDPGTGGGSEVAEEPAEP